MSEMIFKYPIVKLPKPIPIPIQLAIMKPFTSRVHPKYISSRYSWNLPSSFFDLLQSSRVPEFQSSRVPEFQSSRVPELQSSRVRTVGTFGKSSGEHFLAIFLVSHFGVDLKALADGTTAKSGSFSGLCLRKLLGPILSTRNGSIPRGSWFK